MALSLNRQHLGQRRKENAKLSEKRSEMMAKGPTKNMWKRMMIIMLTLVIAGFGTITFQLSKIMLVKAPYYQKLANEQQLRDTTLPARRGTIYDTNMTELAVSATVWQVYITPNDKKVKSDREKIASGLSAILGIDSKKVLAITDKKTGYEKVGNPVEKPVADKVREFILQNKYGSVIGLDESNKRYYPYDNLASTVLGFVGTDNQGLGGIESQYDGLLKGQPGRVVAAKNAKGEDMPFSYEKMVDPVQGKSIVLTIDEYIQHVVEKYLDQAVVDNDVTSKGVCIVMDVNTGAILAMATKPDFNPNEPLVIYDKDKAEAVAKLTGTEQSKLRGEYQQLQWRNKAVSDVYEPGSVFKIITGSAALEEKTTSESAHFNCPGYIQIANRRISCSNHNGHGSQDLAKAFMNSCNPAFITIGQQLGLQKFTKYRKAFGFEALTGIDLPGEAESIYHPVKSMGPVELASESFGQTFKITPIQLITAISASVNGGQLIKPHVLKQVIDDQNNIVQTASTTPIRQVISNDTSVRIRNLLEGVVSSGTGKNAYIPGYRIGGKTGTSQKIDTQSKEGTINKYIASFGAIAPANEPKIAVLMLLDEPHSVNGSFIYGGTIVAPVVGKILNEILPYIGVSPEYTAKDIETLDIKTPEIRGLSVEKAQNTIKNSGLKIRVIGEGTTVVRQVPEPSNLIPKGGTVVVYTNKEASKKMVSIPDFMNMTVREPTRRRQIRVLISDLAAAHWRPRGPPLINRVFLRVPPSRPEPS